MADENKTAPTSAEPRTAKAAMAPTDLLPLPVVSVPPATATAPMTETVVTGKHILTGEPFTAERPIKKPAPTYNTGDRAPYTVHTAITGSLNGRKFDLKVGETVNLNADESKLLKPYVTKVA